jgi:heme exporter protein A
MGSPPQPTLLQASPLTKRYGAVAAVKNASFEIYKGDFVSIFGPNGAGKTTLLQLIANLSSATEGTLRWASSDSSESQYVPGFVSHQSLLYGELSAVENLIFFSRLYGVSRPNYRARQLLDQMGLEGVGHRQVKYYSTGMKQRLTLARALVHDPEILLLDEPYAGLDQHGSRLLTKILSGLREERRTVLLITHNLLEGFALSNRVMIMNRGEIVHQADKEDLESEDLERIYFGLVEG